MNPIKFKDLYEGSWEINPRLKELKEQLAKARTGYYCAIDAIPYMPMTSKPYTRKTARKYFEEIRELKRVIKEIKNGQQ